LFEHNGLNSNITKLNIFVELYPLLNIFISKDDGRFWLTAH